jgi:hypothetical protein
MISHDEFDCSCYADNAGSGITSQKAMVVGHAFPETKCSVLGSGHLEEVCLCQVLIFFPPPEKNPHADNR